MLPIALITTLLTMTETSLLELTDETAQRAMLSLTIRECSAKLIESFTDPAGTYPEDDWDYINSASTHQLPRSPKMTISFPGDNTPCKTCYEPTKNAFGQAIRCDCYPSYCDWEDEGDQSWLIPSLKEIESSLLEGRGLPDHSDIEILLLEKVEGGL